MSEHIHYVTDDSFPTEVLQSEQPVLVDYWAEWCGPCKALGPLVDELSNDLQGRAKVVKINIDESPNAPTKYGVRGIPTMMLFKGGQMASMKVGAMPKQKIVEWLNEAGI